MATIKGQKYKRLVRDVDRYGNVRWYVRIPGKPKAVIGLMSQVPPRSMIDTTPSWRGKCSRTLQKVSGDRRHHSR